MLGNISRTMVLYDAFLHTDVEKSHREFTYQDSPSTGLISNEVNKITWISVIVSVVFKTYIFQLSQSLKAVKALNAVEKQNKWEMILRNQFRISLLKM